VNGTAWLLSVDVLESLSKSNQIRET